MSFLVLIHWRIFFVFNRPVSVVGIKETGIPYVINSYRIFMESPEWAFTRVRGGGITKVAALRKILATVVLGKHMWIAGNRTGKLSKDRRTYDCTFQSGILLTLKDAVPGQKIKTAPFR